MFCVKISFRHVWVRFCNDWKFRSTNEEEEEISPSLEKRLGLINSLALLVFALG